MVAIALTALQTYGTSKAAKGLAFHLCCSIAHDMRPWTVCAAYADNPGKFSLGAACEEQEAKCDLPQGLQVTIPLLVAFSGIWFLMWLFLIYRAKRHLLNLPYADFKFANMFVRLQVGLASGLKERVQEHAQPVEITPSNYLVQ